MKVTLQSLSHPGMREIRIEDTLLSVGRREEPFASLADDAVARLSRRHARIFCEQGEAYILDQGSLNGTEVNGFKLDRDAFRLEPGDEIKLGGAFRFRVDMEDALTAPPDTVLVLSPVAAGEGLEPIVVSRFPFLVSRVDRVFGRYQELFLEDLKQISRRHALFSLKGEEVRVEDLDSANGTFVAGQRLEEQARAIADGDEIVFGSERFRYSVRVERPGREAATGRSSNDETPPVPRTRDGASTVLVSSPSSFLEVFCGDAEEAGDEQAGADALSETGKRPALALRSGGGVLRRLGQAIGPQRMADRRCWWLASMAALLALAVGAGAFLSGAERREIKALLDARNFIASAIAANRFLLSHPGDDEAGAWGQEALVSSIVGEWVDRIEQGRYEQARDGLDLIGSDVGAIPSAPAILGLLQWITDLEAHMASRGGPEGPIVLFRHDDEVGSLVDAWNSQPARHRQLVTQLTSLVPAFEAIQQRTLSHLRILRNDRAVYGRAIADLKAAITQHLRAREHQRIRPLTAEFSKRYPRVGGMAALDADLENYEALVGYLERAQFTRAVGFLQETEFVTPPYRRHLEVWLEEALPPRDVIARFESAAEAWRVGESERSVAILQELLSGPWGEVAAGRIERQEKLLAEYRALEHAAGTKAYRDRLLALWASLRQPEDQHLRVAIEPEVEVHRAQLVAQLDASLNRTASLWKSYRHAGGIPAVMRVEARISNRFKSQARRLSQAHATIEAGTRKHQLVEVTPTPRWRQLRTQIRHEAKRLRRSFEDLHLVLEPELLQAKLAMLPLIEEQAP